MTPEKFLQDIQPVIVQKFGGSTIGDPNLLNAIIRTIGKNLESGYRIVAVVSAMGRKGQPYATETLLSLLPRDPRFVCRRERDLLMSCGEIISAVKLACILRSEGIAAIARTGFEAGIITDGEHGNAKILRINPNRLASDLMLFPCVVVAGFQGMSEQGRITTLGRGGSDTSAMAIGVALHAHRVEIYTDTDGIHSADPNQLPEAVMLKKIYAEDIRQMAWQGANVLHPRAAELAARTGMPTLIGRIDRPDVHSEILPDVSMESRSVITAVACGPGVAQFSVNLSEHADQEQVTHIFDRITRAGISMDMFTLTENLLRFTVADEDVINARAVLGQTDFQFEIREKCVKISIVGAGMHGMRGVMARFARSLISAVVPILQTVDSHATISALIPMEMKLTAQKALHREFIDSDRNNSPE
ncbi:aspartate kinase [bacterium]|nr:aspartate kinase [candidate division CSSED10-310 bacterium]